MQVINKDINYIRGDVWLEQWYEKEDLEIFINKSISEKEWKKFLDWKKNIINDMKFKIIDDYKNFKKRGIKWVIT